MTNPIHAWGGQVTAVVLFTTILVLQIPRKALFFVPARQQTAEPLVSFISLDDQAYDALVRRIRMSWQMRRRFMSAGVGDSRTDAFEFSDPLPPPSYLSRRMPATPSDASPRPAIPQPALLPATQAAAMPPVPSTDIAPDRDPSLLEFPDSIPGAGAPPDFTLRDKRRLE